MPFVFLCWLLLLGPSIASAEQSAYVTDRFEITLRGGPSTEHRIFEMLPSGTRLTVLERTEDGYARVRTADGKEGWVLQRYLQPRPVARERLAELERRAQELETRTAELGRENEALKAENTRLEAALEAERRARTEAETRLQRIREASRNVLALQDENEVLKTELVSLRRELLTLRQESAALHDARQRDWFLSGALVLAVGIVGGLLITRLAGRRRSSWSDL